MENKNNHNNNNNNNNNKNNNNDKEEQTKEESINYLNCGEPVNNMVEAYKDYAVWVKRIHSENASMNKILTVKTEAITRITKKYCDEYEHEITTIINRAKAIGTTMNQSVKHNVFKDILKVFTQFICNKTSVVLDTKTQQAIGSPNSYSYRNSAVDITVGKFGFGLRKNINSQQIRSSADVRYILKNYVTVCKGLRKLKLVQQAKILEELMTITNTLGDLNSGGITVQLNAQKEIPVSKGRLAKAHSIKFGQSYDPIVVISDAGQSSANPLRGTLKFAIYYLLLPEIKITLQEAEGKLVNALTIKDIEEKVQKVLGRWLLLSRL